MAGVRRGERGCSLGTEMWGRPDFQIFIVHVREVFLRLRVFLIRKVIE